MAYEPYKRGDAIRRPIPNAGTCWDCKPIASWEYPVLRQRDIQFIYPRFGGVLCKKRGCVPGPAIDKLAALTHAARRR